MAKENMYCPGQKVLSRKGRDNWERIFRKPVVHCQPYEHYELNREGVYVCPYCGESTDPAVGLNYSEDR